MIVSDEVALAASAALDACLVVVAVAAGEAVGPWVAARVDGWLERLDPRRRVWTTCREAASREPCRRR